MVSQCKLVSGWRLRKRRSRRPMGPSGSGRTLLFFTLLCTLIYNKQIMWLNILNFFSMEILLFWLPGRVAGPEVGPGRKWQGLGPAMSIASAATAWSPRRDRDRDLPTLCRDRDRDLQVLGPRRDRDRDVERPRPRRFSRRWWHFGLP